MARIKGDQSRYGKKKEQEIEKEKKIMQQQGLAIGAPMQEGTAEQNARIQTSKGLMKPVDVEAMRLEAARTPIIPEKPQPSPEVQNILENPNQIIEEKPITTEPSQNLTGLSPEEQTQIKEQFGANTNEAFRLAGERALIAAASAGSIGALASAATAGAAIPVAIAGTVITAAAAAVQGYLSARTAILKNNAAQGTKIEYQSYQASLKDMKVIIDGINKGYIDPITGYNMYQDEIRTIQHAKLRLQYESTIAPETWTENKDELIKIENFLQDTKTLTDGKLFEALRTPDPNKTFSSLEDFGGLAE